MKKKEKKFFLTLFLLFLFVIIVLRRKRIEQFTLSHPLKLVFVGDCMFGRDNNPFTENPFVHVEHVFNDSTHIFLNLETTISPEPLDDSYKDDKVFNYQATGEQLIKLRSLTDNPIFAAIVNNHTLDYKEQGFENTKQFLTDNTINYTVNDPIEKDNIVFFNATDHCGCRGDTLWKQHLDMIDYNNLEPVYEKVRHYPDQFIVYSIHWGPNWVDGEMPDHIKEFGRGLIDAGVNVVFGHSSHHVVQNPVEEYNGGIIIYSLGDFINDYAVKERYESDKALIVEVEVNDNNNQLSHNVIHVQRRFVNGNTGGSIPHII